MCAVFNPPVKDIQPGNPLGWSKSADVPSSFASTIATSIKGIGDLIGQGAKAADELVQQSAKDSAREVIEPIRDDEISRLAGEDFRLKMGLTDTSDTGNSLITKDSAEDLAVPGDLKKDLGTLSVLPDARANGKISPSDYYGRLVSAAKDLRARYPVGYRDYIDKEISKITGVDPANAYMHSLIGDINAAQTNKQAEKNKVLSRLLEHQGLDPIRIPQMFENLNSGRATIRQAMDFLAPLEAEKVNHDRRMMRVRETEAGTKEQELYAEQAFREFTSGTVKTSFDSTLKSAEVNGGLTPAKIRDLQIASFEGKQPLTGEQMFALADQQRAFREQDRNRMIKELDFVDLDPNSKTYRPIPLRRQLGEKGNKMIDDALYGYDQVIDGFVKKDVGAVFNAQKIVTSIKDDYAKIFWKQPDVQRTFGYLHVLQDAGGQNAVSQGWAAAVGTGLPDIQSLAIQSKIANLATAPDPRGPNFKEVNNLTETIKRVENESKLIGDDRYKFKTFEQVQNLVDGKKGFSIVDPNTRPEVVREIFRNFFSPDTRGALRLVKSDVVDPKTNTIVPGQESWFKRFTAPEVVAKATQQDDETKAWYKQWVQMTYEDIFSQNLKNIASTKLDGAYTLSWNPLDLVSPLQVEIKGAGEIRRFTGKTTPIEADVAKLNKGITGLFSMHKGMGDSTETAEAKVLESLLFHLGPNKAYQAVNGIPEHLLDAVKLKYEKAKEEERLKNETKKNYIP